MAKLVERKFEPLDATVIRVGEKLTVQELDDIFGEIAYDKRYYPTDDGWDIRFCAEDVGGLEFLADADIRIERGAWDHEDCAQCGAEIASGKKFYTLHESNGATRILCEKCRHQHKG